MPEAYIVLILNLERGYHQTSMLDCQGVKKLKLLTFSQNWEIRLVFTNFATMVGHNKIFFGKTHRRLENNVNRRGGDN